MPGMRPSMGPSGQGDFFVDGMKNLLSPKSKSAKMRRAKEKQRNRAMKIRERQKRDINTSDRVLIQNTQEIIEDVTQAKEKVKGFTQKRIQKLQEKIEDRTPNHNMLNRAKPNPRPETPDARQLEMEAKGISLAKKLRESGVDQTLSTFNGVKRVKSVIKLDGVDYTLMNKKGEETTLRITKQTLAFPDGDKEVYALTSNVGVQPGPNINAYRSARETTSTYLYLEDLIDHLNKNNSAGYLHYGELPKERTHDYSQLNAAPANLSKISWKGEKAPTRSPIASGEVVASTVEQQLISSEAKELFEYNDQTFEGVITQDRSDNTRYGFDFNDGAGMRYFTDKISLINAFSKERGIPLNQLRQLD